MDKFRKLGISEHIIKAIEEHKFTEPSEIQVKSIPLVLEGKDVVAGSATGSGKTLVFGSGIIQKVEKGKGIQALILEPTRELAEQVTKALEHFSKFKELEIVSVYGGVSAQHQIEGLRYAEVVVGTPGRILDLMERNTLNLRGIKILVLDEADRMLDMGFIRDVEKIVKEVPKDRQTMLFSATIDADIFHLAKRYMRNPVEVSAESYIDESKLPQSYYEVESPLKFSLLVHLLKKEHEGLVMVFCNTRRNADFVSKNLKHLGIDALAIHGGFSQAKRSSIMESFRKQQLYVLVCTDIAARGLDIQGVSHVYNYDIPKDSKDYIHRIGRTARAGKEGLAISLLSDRDFENFRSVLKNSELNIEKQELPAFERVSIQVTSRGGYGSGFRRDSRGSGGGYRRDSGRFGNRGGRDRSEGYSSGGGGYRSRGSGFRRSGSSQSSRDDSSKRRFYGNKSGFARRSDES